MNSIGPRPLHISWNPEAGESEAGMISADDYLSDPESFSRPVVVRRIEWSMKAPLTSLSAKYVDPETYSASYFVNRSNEAEDFDRFPSAQIAENEDSGEIRPNVIVPEGNEIELYMNDSNTDSYKSSNRYTHRATMELAWADEIVEG